MFILSNMQNISCFESIPARTALPLTQKLCSVLKWISVFWLPKGIASKAKTLCLLMNAFCCLVQHRDLLTYGIALPGDAGFAGLSLERQYIEIWKGLQKGALTDLAEDICES